MDANKHKTDETSAHETGDSTPRASSSSPITTTSRDGDKQRRRCVADGCDRCHRGYSCGRRCMAEGCPKRAQDSRFCRRHGGNFKCTFPMDSTSYTQKQKGGMCSSHSGQQDINQVHQGTPEMNALESHAQVQTDGTVTEKENTTREGVGFDAAPSEDTASAVFCHVEGCTAVAEKKGKKGLCRFHSFEQRCNYSGGCHNIAHLNSLFCMTHLALGDTPPCSNSNDFCHASRLDHTISHNNNSAVVIDHAVIECDKRIRTSTIHITARQQELQARQYCDAVLSARSVDLFAVFGDGATDIVDDAPSSRPTIRTTAREQQKIAEQFCNEVLAARAYHFMLTNPTSWPSAPAVAQPPATTCRNKRPRICDRVKECNIHGCRNLANGRALCAAHEAWATGKYAG